MTTLYEASKAKTKTDLPIEDQIKSLADACENQGIEKLAVEVIGLDKEDTESVEAFVEMLAIRKALNQQWKAKTLDTNQYKYSPWHKVSALELSCNAYASWSSYSHLGSRLSLENPTLAKYFGTQFLPTINKFFNIK